MACWTVPLVMSSLALAACGRISFDPLSTSDAQSDSAPPQEAADSGQPAMIVYAKAFGARAGTGTSDSFTIQADKAGDAVLVHVGCYIQSGATFGYSLTAPGWQFTQITPMISQGLLRGMTLIAIAPDTTPVTASAQWLGGVSCSGWNLNADEFTNNDPAGDLTTFESVMETGGSGDCVASITTKSDHDAIWAGCTSSGAINSVDPSYTEGTNDTAGDHSEYKLTTDPAGTVETATFANPGQTFVMGIIAIKPRAL